MPTCGKKCLFSIKIFFPRSTRPAKGLARPRPARCISGDKSYHALVSLRIVSSLRIIYEHFMFTNNKFSHSRQLSWASCEYKYSAENNTGLKKTKHVSCAARLFDTF